MEHEKNETEVERFGFFEVGRRRRSQLSLHTVRLLGKVDDPAGAP